MGILPDNRYTEFKDDEDVLLGFQTTEAQIRALLSDKGKNRTFWPPVKIREGVGEIYGSMIVVVHMTDPPVFGIHLMGGLAAAAENRVPVKKEN